MIDVSSIRGIRKCKSSLWFCTRVPVLLPERSSVLKLLTEGRRTYKGVRRKTNEEGPPTKVLWHIPQYIQTNPTVSFYVVWLTEFIVFTYKSGKTFDLAVLVPRSFPLKDTPGVPCPDEGVERGTDRPENDGGVVRIDGETRVERTVEKERKISTVSPTGMRFPE